MYMEFFFCFLTKVFGSILLVPDPASIAANQAGKEEVDARSVFVGNVRIFMFLRRFLSLSHLS